MGVDDIADRTAFEGVKVFRERWSKNPTAWKVQIMRAKKNPFEINETVSKVYAWKHLMGSKLGKHRDHGDIGELLRYQIVPKNNFMGQNFSLLDDAWVSVMHNTSTITESEQLDGEFEPVLCLCFSLAWNRCFSSTV